MPLIYNKTPASLFLQVFFTKINRCLIFFFFIKKWTQTGIRIYRNGLGEKEYYYKIVSTVFNDNKMLL